MALPEYLTPLELAVLAWPANVRPEELGPGRTSQVTATRYDPPGADGVGTGTFQVVGAAFDAHDVLIEVLTTGEPGGATFRYQTDGATWSDAQVMAESGVEQPLLSTKADDLTEGADTGLRVIWTAGSPTPSFRDGDLFAFTTQPVARIRAATLGACAELKAVIAGPDGGGRFTGDISFVDVGLKRALAEIARLSLVESRGIDPNSAQDRLYLESAKLARMHLSEVAEKLRHPDVTEDGGPIYAPSVLLGMDRYGISAAHRKVTAGNGRC